jgi:serine phosphatase RsbU (regulator of sigma subunit)
MIKKTIFLLLLFSVNLVFLYSRPDADSLLYILNNLRKESEKLESKGNYKQALQLYKQYAALKDTVINKLHVDQTRDLKEKYEREKIVNELKLQQAEKEKSETNIRRREWTTIFWIIVFPVIAIFMILFYRQLRINLKNRKLMQQQNVQFENQKETLDKQSKEISNHITYARIIQSAILSLQNTFDEYFTEHFIFFKPKHIVSGDFYWSTRKDNLIYLAVADCTGHEVQGAFLSFLGMKYLEEIVNRMHPAYTDEILSQLSTKINQSLSENDLMFEAKDGMDIAICIIDTEKMELQFSGAFNPVFIISDNNLEVLRGDRIPIGYSMKEDVYFSRQHIQLNTGDIIYLLSDGYCDQLGGESRKKYMTKRFNHLLLDIYQFPLEKQKEWLDKTFSEWMGDNDQVDDVTVIGVKI